MCRKKSHKSLNYYRLRSVAVGHFNLSHVCRGILFKGMMTCVMSGSRDMGNAVESLTSSLTLLVLKYKWVVAMYNEVSSVSSDTSA